MANVKKILVFVVSGDPGPARFERVYDKEVRPEQDYKDVIDKLARDDVWDRDFGGGLSDVSKEHTSKQAANRDGLNIHLGKEDDPIAIAICLPKHDGHNQLEFRGKPIIELWTNSGTGETFIGFEHKHRAAGNRWASFVCNPREARESQLADYIRKLPDRFEGHRDKMRIPFTYNICDERMNFAPWVLSDHSEEKKNHKGAERGDQGIVTHGGVHPYSSYYLTIDL